MLARYREMLAPDWIVNMVATTAGACSVVSFVPQIMKALKERDMKAMSLRMLAITNFGFACWTLYGLLSGSWPVVLSNLVNFALVATLLVLKLRFRKTPAEQSRVGRTEHA